jgi:hypothetical protein
MPRSFRLRYMRYERAVMNLKPRINQRNTSVSALIGGFETTSRCQDVSFGTSVPAGVERYLCPACRGAILGPRSRRSERKRDR